MSAQKKVQKTTSNSSNAPKKTQGGNSTLDFAFGKMNYILMFAGLFFLALGYILMLGGGSDDPATFSYKLFNFQRLTLSPFLLLIGFIVEIFAIMYQPKAKKQDENE